MTVSATPIKISYIFHSFQGTYIIKLKCPMIFDSFPFDTHHCSILVST